MDFLGIEGQAVFHASELGHLQEQGPADPGESIDPHLFSVLGFDGCAPGHDVPGMRGSAGGGSAW